jgi:phosphatidylserine decarboxylase
VTYVPGDTWNVNPATLKRIEKLFCKNERAILRTRLAASEHTITLVPVAAILVASLRLNFLNLPLIREHRASPIIPCDAPFQKGQEMGWFEHGSTIIVLAPNGFTLCENVAQGAVLRVGDRLMRLPRAQ